MLYRSCDFIEKGISFDNTNNSICVCCHCSNVGGGYGANPFIEDIVTGQKIDWDGFFNEKSRIRKANSSDTVDKICEGCVVLRENDWPENNKMLSHFNFHHFTKCDSNCVYCYTAEDKKHYNTRKCYKVYPILKDFKKKNLIAPLGFISFGGGEVALLNEFEDIIKFFMAYNYTMQVCTSAIHYSRPIEKALKNGNMEILISVDSGTKETFSKIKGTKRFDAVWKNIKKYAKAQKFPILVKTKFIVVPEFNDTEEEILLWLKKSKEAGINAVVMEIESGFYERNRSSMPKEIVNLFDFALKNAKDLGLEFSLYDRASHMMKEQNWDYWQDFDFVKDNTMQFITKYMESKIALSKKNN